MDLKDQSGEMSATFFGRAVDKYYNMLKCGQARLQSCFVVVDYLYLWQPPKKDRKVNYHYLSGILFSELFGDYYSIWNFPKSWGPPNHPVVMDQN